MYWLRERWQINDEYLPQTIQYQFYSQAPLLPTPWHYHCHIQGRAVQGSLLMHKRSTSKKGNRIYLEPFWRQCSWLQGLRENCSLFQTPWPFFETFGCQKQTQRQHKNKIMCTGDSIPENLFDVLPFRATFTVISRKKRIINLMSSRHICLMVSINRWRGPAPKRALTWSLDRELSWKTFFAAAIEPDMSPTRNQACIRSSAHAPQMQCMWDRPSILSPPVGKNMRKLLKKEIGIILA